MVFDASAVVSAALKQNSVPEQALLQALSRDVLALSPPVEAEIIEVLSRPRFSVILTEARRHWILSLLVDGAIWFNPTDRVTDCRDAKDNIYLELALSSRADTIVTGDSDLLVLHPWRAVRIIRPADYLALGR